MNETATMTGTAPRWWAVEYTAVPDPIEADTEKGKHSTTEDEAGRMSSYP